MIEPVTVPPTSVPYQHDMDYENGVESSSEETQARIHHDYARGNYMALKIVHRSRN